jgi:putative acetyltransferase
VTTEELILEHHARTLEWVEENLKRLGMSRAELGRRIGYENGQKVIDSMTRGRSFTAWEIERMKGIFQSNQDLVETNADQNTGREGLLIRAARLEDAEALTALVNMPGFRAGTLRLPFQAIEQTQKWLERRSETGLNLVAVLDDEIVGNADFIRFSGRRAHAAGLGMGVHDDHAGKGIGSALLAALIDAADNWFGLKRLELAVFTDNTRAIKLYERHGFEREGVQRAFAFRAGEYADALSMARVRI